MKQVKYHLKQVDNLITYKVIILVLSGLIGASFINNLFLNLNNDYKYVLLNFIMIIPLLITLSWGWSYAFFCMVIIMFQINIYSYYSEQSWVLLLFFTNYMIMMMIISNRSQQFYSYGDYYFYLIPLYILYIFIVIALNGSVFYCLQGVNNACKDSEALIALHGSSAFAFTYRLLVIQAVVFAISEVLQLLPCIKRIFRLEVTRCSKYNTPIILGASAFGVFLCAILVMDFHISKENNLSFYSLHHPSEAIRMTFLAGFVICFIFGGIQARITEALMDMMLKRKNSETKYRQIFENLNDIYMETTWSGVILEVSPSIHKILGYQEKDLVGTNVMELYVNQADRYYMLKNLAVNGELENYTILIRDTVAKQHTMWTHAKLQTDRNGTKRVMIILRDISQYMEEHTKRQESERYYKMLFDEMMNGFLVLGPVYNKEHIIEDVIFIDANPGFERSSGMSNQFVLGKTWSQVMQYKHRYLEEYQEILDTGGCSMQEVYNPTLKQYYKCMTFKINEDRVGCIFEDITEKKRTEDELKELAANLEAIFQSTDDNIWLVDHNFNLLACNQAFFNMVKRLTGYELRRNKMKDIMPGIVRHKWEILYKRAISEGHFVFEGEYKGVTFEVSLNPIYKDDKPVGVAMFGKDITERKKADRELAKLNVELELRVQNRTQELQRVVQELEAFNYMVSHDLKSPLRAIYLHSRIMLEDYREKMTGEMEATTDRVMKLCQDMLHMIDKLLEYSTTSNVCINKQIININTVIRKSFESITCVLQDRNIELMFDSQIPPLMVDEVLIKQVLDNILSNAVKFTQTRDCAVIKVNCTRSSEEVIISISDNGIGFDMAEADNIFHAFERLSSAQEYEGSGIGLATVKKIIKLHGGRTWMEGYKDIGATIYFTIPFFIQGGSEGDG